KSCEGKLSHLGIEPVGRSSLSYMNEHRPWELYEKVFFDLLGYCQSQGHWRHKFRFKNKLMSLDSTVIDLCVSLYDWAKFRRTKGAVKLHLLLDHDGYLPAFAVITPGKVHDVRVARTLKLQPGTIIVDDRGYTDYELFGRWTDEGVYFVTRMRDNAVYEVIEAHPVPSCHSHIQSDQVIRLTGKNAENKCPHPLRRIEVRDQEQQRTLVFLTNHPWLSAATIAAIYKDRWSVELFFKALKQNLKLKTFVGTSPNAVKIQIWTALIAMLILRFLQLKSKFGWSLSNLVALLRMNLFTYRDLWAWLDEPFATPPDPGGPEQVPLAL
ncbi:MAG TPA: IS4 family transposase, partial [Gammaproteobacteria bacterium]|nr:IS4 family transposase [Gammaproteobacteria bacterium]